MRGLLLLATLLAACARPPASKPPASVLLVTHDTLRADRVGAYGDAVQGGGRPHCPLSAASPEREGAGGSPVG